MKKIIISIIVLLVIGVFLIYIFRDKLIDNGIPILEVENEKVNINKYYVYGTHLNMEGTLEISDTDFEDINLVMYNGEFKNIDMNYEIDGKIISFNLSDKINDGLYLDELPLGKYPIFIELLYENPDKEAKEEEKTIHKYYTLKNNTEYKETKYFSVSDTKKEIFINSNNDYETIMLEIDNSNDEDVYDIVLDPGHGGMDGGAETKNKEYNENMFTLELAEMIKERLEDANIKVKLTREEDTLTKNEIMEEYGTHGRAVVSSEVNAKYLLSLHFNSNDYAYVNGIEIYTAVGINYDFAKLLASNIKDYTGLNYSTNMTKRVTEGIYSHNFTEAEVNASLERYAKKEYAAYEISTNSNYYYMIRETGGIITGAYVDDRNADILANPYYNSNKGTESYILELGYITNENDLNNYINNKDKYADAIADSIKKFLNF